MKTRTLTLTLLWLGWSVTPCFAQTPTPTPVPANPIWTNVGAERPWAFTSPAYTPETQFATVFNGRMWLGLRRSTGLNESSSLQTWSTADGADWKQESLLDNADSLLQLMIGFQDKLITLSTRPYYSSDGIHWNAGATVPNWDLMGQSLAKVATVLDNTLYVAVDFAGPRMWKSTNGIYYSRIEGEGPVLHPLQLAGHDGYLWLLGADNNSHAQEIWKSFDGAAWTPVSDNLPWGTAEPLTMAAMNGALWYVPDPAACQSPAWLADFMAKAVVQEGRIVTFGSEPSYTMTWSPAHPAWEFVSAPTIWSIREAPAGLSFNDRMWILGGKKPNAMAQVWSSVNGATWTLETVSAPWGRLEPGGAAVFADRIWVVQGGEAADGVWSSTDGIQWNRELQHVPWSARTGHAVAAHAGKLWLLGGFDSSTKFNDVWSSPDGREWTLVLPSVSWMGRTGLRALSHDGRLWALGNGAGPDGRTVHDVWSSVDGRAWTRGTDVMPNGNAMTALAWEDRMWLVGGHRSPGMIEKPHLSIVIPNYAKDLFLSGDGIEWATWPGANFDAPGAPSYRADPVCLVFQGKLWLMAGDAQLHLNSLPQPLGDVWSATGLLPEPPRATPTPTPTATLTPTPTPPPGPESAMLFVLDDYGAVHTGGAANSIAFTGGPYFGWNIARDMALLKGLPTTNDAHLGVAVLDGYGALHTFSAMRPPQNFYFAPSDVASQLALFQTDLCGVPGNIGYFVLDRFGKLWAAGEADPAVAAAGSIQPPLDGNTVRAVSVVLADNSYQRGYIMDNMGHVYPFGGALDPQFPVSAQNNWIDLETVDDQLVRIDASGQLTWSGTPHEDWMLPMVDGGLIIDLEVEPGHGLVALDRYGAIYASSTAVRPLPQQGPPYFGFPAARALEIGPPFGSE